MDIDWESKLLKLARDREDEARFNEFVRLVEQVDGRCTLDVARILMKTFWDQPDYGSQECVVSVMASGIRRDFIVAMLEELPRLVDEAPEWANTLVGGEVWNNPELLSSIASAMPDNIKSTLRKLLDSKSFHDDLPDAKQIEF